MNNIFSQFIYFFYSFILGFIFSFSFVPFTVLKQVINLNIIHIIFDVIFFVFLALAFNYCMFIFHFPTIRVFIIVAFLLGVYLYMKTFNIILAKFLKKFYNKYIKRNKGKRCYDGDKV